MIKPFYYLMFTALLYCHSASAETVTIEFELPSFDIADYQKPYVAIWMEGEKPQSLLLWHLTRRSEDKWLVDIRRWWRKLGRYDNRPDGLTGATRGPGKYKESFQINSGSPFKLYVEVVREDGGRSLLSQDIDFSKNQSHYTLPADSEIGELTISVGNKK